MKDIYKSKPSRRNFIAKSFSACTFCFLAAPTLSAIESQELRDTFQKHKFDTDSGMSIQQAFNFAYKWWYIPAMKNLMQQIGKDEFLSMLRKSSEMIQSGNYKTLKPEQRTLSAMAKMVKDNYGSNPRLTLEMINQSEDTLEFNYTECLWAKTFREAKAEDIGYAGICYQDYPLTKAFNPKYKLVRTKTLMEGHDCCNFKIVLDT